jgi:membrane-associated phospholipid phosphatase
VALLPVALLMVWQVRRGRWNNVDASNRSERPVLFLVGAAGVVALIARAMFARPESFLVRGALGVLGMIAACALATRWSKVSLHMAFATLATTSLLLLGSPLGWPALAAVPLLAWSRVRLGRHATGEVVAGGVAALVLGWAIHLL